MSNKKNFKTQFAFLHFAFRIIRCMFSIDLLECFYVHEDTKINLLSCHLKRNAQLRDDISCRTTTKLLLFLVEGKEIA